MRWPRGGDPFVQEARGPSAGDGRSGVEHVDVGGTWRRVLRRGAPGGAASGGAAPGGAATGGAATGGAVQGRASPAASRRRALRLAIMVALAAVALGVLLYWGYTVIENSQGGANEAAPGLAAEAVLEPGESVPGTDGYVVEGYEYRGLELERHIYRDYHFSVDVPGTPYELKGEDRGDWDFGVRLFVDVPGVRDDAVFEVLAAVQSGTLLHGETAVARYLADVEAQYTGEHELRSATSGRINGHPCAIARSRYAGSQNPEPVVTTAFWVPGEGYEYLVRCIAFEDDWARPRRPMMDIAGRFRCW